MPDEEKPAWLLALEAQQPRVKALTLERKRKPKIPKTLGELYEYARELTPLAIETLVDVMENGRSEAARVTASTALLDRAWGKPVTPIEHGGTVNVSDGARERLAALLAKIVESRELEAEDKSEIKGELISSESMALGPPPEDGD